MSKKKNISPWPENDFWHADIAYVPTAEELARIDIEMYISRRVPASENGPPASIDYRVGNASAHIVVETSLIDDTVEFQVAFYQYGGRGEFRIHHAHPCVGHHQFHHHNMYATLAEARDVVRRFVTFEHRRNEDIVAIQVSQNVAAEIRGRMAA